MALLSEWSSETSGAWCEGVLWKPGPVGAGGVRSRRIDKAAAPVTEAKSQSVSHRCGTTKGAEEKKSCAVSVALQQYISFKAIH